MALCSFLSSVIPFSFTGIFSSCSSSSSKMLVIPSYAFPLGYLGIQILYDSAFCCCCCLLEHYGAPQFPYHLFIFCSLPCGSLFLLQHLVPLFTCIVQNYRSRQFQFCLAHYLACDSFLSIIWCILFIEATVGSRKTTPNCFNCEVVRCQKLIQFTLQGIHHYSNGSTQFTPWLCHVHSYGILA